jgi:hypothetical protein
LGEAPVASEIHSGTGLLRPSESHAIRDTRRRSRYALSFTSGALLIREAVIAAPIYLREHDWAKVRQFIEEDNLLQSRTVSTGQRFAREVAQRLAVLADDELGLLVDSTTSERGHLLWAAACRRSDLIGEFAEEVLRERFFLLTPKLEYDDFNSFVRSKALWPSYSPWTPRRFNCTPHHFKLQIRPGEEFLRT